MAAPSAGCRTLIRHGRRAVERRLFFFCLHPADDYGMNCVSSVYGLNQSPNMNVSALEVNVFKTLRCNAIGQNVADNVDQDTDAQYRKLPYQIACL